MAKNNEGNSPSPQSQVIANGYLLEIILSNFSPLALLRFQSVSRTWQQTINTSPIVQERLFLRPVRNREQEPEYNPLLKHLFPPFFIPTPEEGLQDSPGCATKSDLIALSWYQEPASRKAVLRSDASWRRMFPVQPPAKVGQIDDSYSCGCFSEEFTALLVEEAQDGGIKMGMLYDVVISLFDEDAFSGGVSLKWCMFPCEPGDIEHTVATERHSGRVIVEEETLQNKILIHSSWDRNCYAKRSSAPSGLEVGDFDKRLLTWSNLEYDD